MLQSHIIKQRKKQLGLTTNYIATYTGASIPSVARWLAGDTKKISPERLEKLAEVLQTSPDHLLGNDEMSNKKPILGIVKAGYNMYAEENIMGYEEVNEKEKTQGDYYLKVCGDSMINARICDGDLLYIKSCNDVQSGDIAIILIGENEATVKRVIKKENLLILEAANPNVENMYFSAKDVEELPVRIIGKVLYNKIRF